MEVAVDDEVEGFLARRAAAEAGIDEVDAILVDLADSRALLWLLSGTGGGEDESTLDGRNLGGAMMGERTVSSLRRTARLAIPIAGESCVGRRLKNPFALRCDVDVWLERRLKRGLERRRSSMGTKR